MKKVQKKATAEIKEIKMKVKEAKYLDSARRRMEDSSDAIWKAMNLNKKAEKDFWELVFSLFPEIETKNPNIRWDERKIYYKEEV